MATGGGERQKIGGEREAATLLRGGKSCRLSHTPHERERAPSVLGRVGAAAAGAGVNAPYKSWERVACGSFGREREAEPKKSAAEPPSKKEGPRDQKNRAANKMGG